MKTDKLKPVTCSRCGSDYLESRPLTATDRLLKWLGLHCAQCKRFRCIACFWEGLKCV